MPREGKKVNESAKKANELSNESKMEEKEPYGECSSSSQETHSHSQLQADAQSAHISDDVEQDDPKIQTLASAVTTVELGLAHLPRISSAAASSTAADNENQVFAPCNLAISSQSQSQLKKKTSLISTTGIIIGHDQLGQCRARIQGISYQSPYAVAGPQAQTSTQALHLDVGMIPNDTPHSWSMVPDVTNLPSFYKSLHRSSWSEASHSVPPPRMYRKLSLKLPQSALLQPAPSRPAISLLVSSQLVSPQAVPPRQVSSKLVPARVAPPPPAARRPLALSALQPAFPVADALPGPLTLASKPTTATSSTRAVSAFQQKASPNPFSAPSASTLQPPILSPSNAQEGLMRCNGSSRKTVLKPSLSKSKKMVGQEGPRKTIRFSIPVSADLPFDRPRYSPYPHVQSMSTGRRFPTLLAGDKQKESDGDGDNCDNDDEDDGNGQVSAASSIVKSTGTGLSGGGRKRPRKRRRTSKPPSVTASSGSTYDTPYAAILPPVSPDATAAVPPPAAEIQQVGAPVGAAASGRFTSVPILPFTPESAAFTERLFQGLGSAPLSGWDASASPYPAGYFAGTAPLAPPPLQHQQRQSVGPSAAILGEPSAPLPHWGTVDPVFYRWAQPAGAQDSSLDSSSPAASGSSFGEWESYDPRLWEKATEQVDHSAMSFMEHWHSLSIGIEDKKERHVRAANTTMRRPAARGWPRSSQAVSSRAVRRLVSPVRSSGQMSDECPPLVSVRDFAVSVAPLDGQLQAAYQGIESMLAPEITAQPAPGAVAPAISGEQSPDLLLSSNSEDAAGRGQVAPAALSGCESSAAGAVSTAHHGTGHKRSHDISGSDSDSSSTSSSFSAMQLDGSPDQDTAGTSKKSLAARIARSRRRRLQKQRKRQKQREQRQRMEQQQKQGPHHDNADESLQTAHTSGFRAEASIGTQAGPTLNTSGRRSHNVQAAAALSSADGLSRSPSNFNSMHPDRYALLSQSGNMNTSLESVHPDRHALLSDAVEQVVEAADTILDTEAWTMHPDRYARLQEIEVDERARQANPIKAPTGPANPGSRGLGR